jgi:elongator complex protein 3
MCTRKIFQGNESVLIDDPQLLFNKTDDHQLHQACRAIIHNLLTDPKSQKQLDQLKKKISSRFALNRLPSNSMILAAASPEEKPRLLSTLVLKPVRSASGINIVAVMSAPSPCPHGNCVFCPSIKGVPNSYTGNEPSAMRGIQNNFDPFQQVTRRLQQLKQIGHSVSKVELVIQGGTFPANPVHYQHYFVRQCLNALTGTKSTTLNEAKEHAEISTIKNVGITLETRPDYAKSVHVDRMLDMGVTKVEIGVQSIYEDIYHLMKRGHTLKDVIDSTRILKDAGMKICYHMMPGLPGSDYHRDLNCFRELFANPEFKPDMLKIYPCLVVKGSTLYDWWKLGKYIPYTTQEATELLCEIKQTIPSWVRIMRIQRDIPSQLIHAGVKKSNLRQIVLNQLHAQGQRCQCIRCREVGLQTIINTTNKAILDPRVTINKYVASEGDEVFIAVEDLNYDILIGYLRLRIPSEKGCQTGIVTEKSALIREIHIYGPQVPVGKRLIDAWQHKGYGAKLLHAAENIAHNEYDRTNLHITSALGSRNYFRRLGYHASGPYMVKSLL